MKRWAVIILSLILLFGLISGAESALIDYKLSGNITGWTFYDWSSRDILYPTEVFGVSTGDHFKINFTLDTNAIQRYFYYYPSPDLMVWDIRIKQYYVGFFGGPYSTVGNVFQGLGGTRENQFYQYWQEGGVTFVSKSGEPVYFNGIENILNLDNFYSSFYIYGEFSGYLDGPLEVGALVLKGEIDKLKLHPQSVSNLSASLMQESGNFEGTLDTLNAHPVSEPSTLLLLGSGMVGLAWFGKRRFSK